MRYKEFSWHSCIWWGQGSSPPSSSLSTQAWRHFPRAKVASFSSCVSELPVRRCKAFAQKDILLQGYEVRRQRYLSSICTVHMYRGTYICLPTDVYKIHVHAPFRMDPLVTWNPISTIIIKSLFLQFQISWKVPLLLQPTPGTFQLYCSIYLAFLTPSSCS